MPSGPFLHYGKGRDQIAVMDLVAAQHNVQNPDAEPRRELYVVDTLADGRRLMATMLKHGTQSKLLQRHIPAWTIVESNEEGHEFP